MNVSSTIYKPDLCHTREHSTGDGGPAVSHQHQAGYDFPWPPTVFELKFKAGAYQYMTLLLSSNLLNVIRFKNNFQSFS